MICDTKNNQHLKDSYKSSIRTIENIRNIEVVKGSNLHLDSINLLNISFKSLYEFIHNYNNNLIEDILPLETKPEKIVNQAIDLANNFSHLLVSYKSNDLYNEILIDITNQIDIELTRLYNIIPKLIINPKELSYQYFKPNDNISLLANTSFADVWDNEDDEYWESYLD